MVYVSENEQMMAVKLINELRNNNIYADVIFGANIKKQMKKATSSNAKFVVIIGEEEIKTGKLTVKDFDLGNEEKILNDQIIQYLLGKSYCER